MACTRVAYRSDDLGPLRRSGVCVREPRRRLGAGHRVTRATGGTADRTAQRTSDSPSWDTAPHGPGSRREHLVDHLLVPSNDVVLSYMYQYIVYIRDRERVAVVIYILGEIRTGSPNDETPWLPNKEMTKPCEVSDETSTNIFPHF